MPEKYTNHLINEKSPYLLQHAHNPVNWFPWGEEAFAKAKAEDKPILLSIGYSTCHWCHVMERESFENEETARILNEHFISIKVDREERPDVDAVYMDVCMAMNRNGGWPLTVLMTPEQKPFFTATYIPREQFNDLLLRTADMWKNAKNRLTASAESIGVYMNEQLRKNSRSGKPSPYIVHEGVTLLQKSFDEKYGGFGGAPKFPTPHNLLFLMRQYERTKDETLLAVVEQTLDRMFRGGIFDHIGGGFSRYSTDRRWLVPHFEKMLYDNALLLYAYAEAYRLTGKELYQYVCARTAEYVLRELTHEEGGFYCGQDADSDGVEGKYYVFAPDEILTILGDEAGKAFCKAYGITERGNFEGKSIPNLVENDNYENEYQNREAQFNLLLGYRLTRAKLYKDDKILTAWNALMIAAFARTYFVFEKTEYLDAAIIAYDFIKNNLTDAGGRLKVRWRDGESGGDGKLDDYAFLAFAALELYGVTFDAFYLEDAVRLAAMLRDKFFDDENGGFFLYASDSEQLITRPKEIYDGAMPSGNSVASLVFARLFALTASMDFKETADKQMSFVAGGIKDYPASYSFSLIAMSEFLFPPADLVCASAEENIREELLSFLRKNKLPHINILLKTGKNSEPLAKIAPFTANYPVPEKGTRYYICKNGTCIAPKDRLEISDFLNL